MNLYTIYKNPSDFPGDFVVKKWADCNLQNQDLNFVKIAKTIEDARNFLPPGLVNLGRYVDDDPVIYESWI